MRGSGETLAHSLAARPGQLAPGHRAGNPVPPPGPRVERADRAEITQQRRARHPRRIRRVGHPPELEPVNVNLARFRPAPPSRIQVAQPHAQPPPVLHLRQRRAVPHPPRREERVHLRNHMAIAADQEHLAMRSPVRCRQLPKPAEPCQDRIFRAPRRDLLQPRMMKLPRQSR